MDNNQEPSPEDRSPNAGEGGRAEESLPTLLLPVSTLDGYAENTACIRYRDGSGRVKDWFVGASPDTDSEESLREHLRGYLPAAEFVGWVIK